MYWPLLEIDPGPTLTSPPLTVQLTEAAPPLFSVAENSSTAVPELLTALQPVQLVSTVAKPGEMERVPFDEVPDAVPPQPASRTKIGTAPAASNRACQRPASFAFRRGKGLLTCLPTESRRGLCGSVVSAVPRLNVPGAFLANGSAQSSLDVLR